MTRRISAMTASAFRSVVVTSDHSGSSATL